MRYIIFSVFISYFLFILQVYGGCKLQTSGWYLNTLPCPAASNSKDLSAAETHHCGRAPSTPSHCCGFYKCDQYGYNDVVKNQDGTQVEIKIHCESGNSCGNNFQLAFDQTDYGNINGCIGGIITRFGSDYRD